MTLLVRDSIGRVRVQASHPAGPVAARLRLERLLSSSELSPPGMPPHAVLIVRRFQAPSLQAVPSGPTPSWQHAIIERMQELYRQAARPVEGSVPSSAPSVLFADSGELLACLTRDALGQMAFQRWYWQQLLGRTRASGGELIGRAWSEQATWLPAALAQLDLWEAVAAVGKLSPLQLSRVVRALHDAWALPPAVLNLSVPGSQVAVPGPEAGESLEHRAVAKVFQADMRPPWWRFARTSMPSQLTPQQHYLLGMCAALAQAPADARSRSFARDAAAWLDRELRNEQADGVDFAEATPVAHGASFSPLGQTTDTDSEDAEHSMVSEVEAHRSSTERVLLQRQAGADGRSGSAEEEALRPRVQHDVLFATVGGHRINSDAPASAESAGETDLTAGRPSGAAVAPVAPEAGGMPTQLAGALYLINLLGWLGLPEQQSPRQAVLGTPMDENSCARAGSVNRRWRTSALRHGGTSVTDAPRAGAMPFSGQVPDNDQDWPAGWAAVEILARGLLGLQHDTLSDDPLWSALAALDGRDPHEPAGTGWPGFGAYRLPVSWLQRAAGNPLGQDAILWRVHVVEQRLLIATSSFLVADVPLAGRDPDVLSEAELRLYRSAGTSVNWEFAMVPPPPALPAGIETAMTPRAAWWLGRVLPFCRRLLVRLLRLGDESELAPALLLKPGRLEIGRTHVDAFLSLDGIDPAVRRAGLDFDPGWAPELGRIVLFHFV